MAQHKFDRAPAPNSFIAASRIMKRRFISPEIVEKVLGVSFSSDQLERLKNIQFDTTVLKAVMRTHILIPAFKQSVASVLRLPGLPKTIVGGTNYILTDHVKNVIMASTLESGWYLIKLNHLRKVRGTYFEQCAQSPTDSMVPALATIMYAFKLLRALGIPFLHGPQALWTRTEIEGHYFGIQPFKTGDSALQVLSRIPSDHKKLIIGSEVRPRVIRSN